MEMLSKILTYAPWALTAIGALVIAIQTLRLRAANSEVDRLAASLDRALSANEEMRTHARKLREIVDDQSDEMEALYEKLIGTGDGAIVVFNDWVLSPSEGGDSN